MRADEDDDLPVLTDVLRVRAPSLPQARDPGRASTGEAPSERFDGVATPDDLDAILQLREGASDAAASAAAPVAFDSDALATRVRDAVLEDLAQRIDTELDARLAQSLTAQLESALSGLQSGLRANLADALCDVVRRAVDEEIARVSTTRDS